MSSIRSLTLVLLLAGTCRAEPVDPQSNPEHTLRRPWGQVLVLNGSKHIAGTGWGSGARQTLGGQELDLAPGRGPLNLALRVVTTRNRELDRPLRRHWAQLVVLNGSKHIAGTGWGSGANQTTSGLELAFAPGRGSLNLALRIVTTRNRDLDLPLPGSIDWQYPMDTTASAFELSLGLRKDFWLSTPVWTPWVSAGVVLISSNCSFWADDLSLIVFEGSAMGPTLGTGVQLRFLDHGVLGLELRHSSAWTLLSPRYGGDATDSYHSNSGGRSIALTFGLIW
ncbi:MAG: hypothetical protein H6678_13965 [Candidatus Delongbacteria bacterium]|nr:hypothetical protein [Candidatus Delongbacteria bacterium]